MATQTEDKVMSLADVSAKTGLNKGYLEKLVKHGYLKPKAHWGPVTRPKPLPKGPSPTDARRFDRDNYKGSETERIDKIRDARRDKMPWDHYLEKEVVSSEERFKEFWELPRGKQRLLDPRTRREIENIDRGYPVWTQDTPIVIVSPGVVGSETGYIDGSLEGQMEHFGKVAPREERDAIHMTQEQVDQMIADRVSEKLEELGVTTVIDEKSGEVAVEAKTETKAEAKPKRAKAKKGRPKKRKSSTREE